MSELDKAEVMHLLEQLWRQKPEERRTSIESSSILPCCQPAEAKLRRVEAMHAARIASPELWTGLTEVTWHTELKEWFDIIRSFRGRKTNYDDDLVGLAKLITNTLKHLVEPGHRETKSTCSARTRRLRTRPRSSVSTSAIDFRMHFCGCCGNRC